MILSHDEKWEVNKEWVYQNIKEGRDAIDNMFTEIRGAGYCSLIAEKDPDTKRVVKYCYVFTDTPWQEVELGEDQFLCGGSRSPAVRGGETHPSGKTPPSEEHPQKNITEEPEQKEIQAQAEPVQTPAAKRAESIDASLPDSEGGRLRLPQPPEVSAAPPLARKPKPRDKPSDPRHHSLTVAFCEAYSTRFGAKYLFQGAKDAAAISALLRANDGKSVPEIMEIIIRAWDSKQSFIRSVSVTLARIPSIWPQLVASEAPATPRVSSVVKMRGDQW